MNTSPSVRITLLPVDQELAGWFADDVGAETRGGNLVAEFMDEQFRIESFPSKEDMPELLDTDMVLGLIRFVDVLSLQHMEELLRSAPQGLGLSAILVYRNENEQDFKMSCPYCGQKLWVRDADKDKRGRCPHCRKGFTLPEQEKHVSSVLRLKDRVPVFRVIRNDPASLGAPLRKVLEGKGKSGPLENLDTEGAFMNNQTMNAHVEDPEEG